MSEWTGWMNGYPLDCCDYLSTFCTKKKLILAKEDSTTVLVNKNELKSSLASQTKNTTLACNEGVVEKNEVFPSF